MILMSKLDLRDGHVLLTKGMQYICTYACSLDKYVRYKGWLFYINLLQGITLPHVHPYLH